MARWEPPECWCGWRARRWVGLMDEGGRVWRRLPVCDAHGDLETMPVDLKLEIAFRMAEEGVQTVTDGRGWVLGPVVSSADGRGWVPPSEVMH